MTRTYRTGPKSLMASTGALFLAGCATIETPAHATSEQSEPYTVHALMTDDHDIYIAAPPDVAWK